MRKQLSFVVMISLIATFFPLTDSQATYGDVSKYLGHIYAGDGGTAAAAYFDFPEDIEVDSSGNFFVADTYNNVIRKISSAGTVSTLAGTGSYGLTNGATTAAEFALPRGITIDASGNIYVADTANNAVRKIAGSTVTTLVGEGLSAPEGLIIYGSTLYIADTGNDAIKSVSTAGGTVTTLAGSGLSSPKKLEVAADGSLLYVSDAGSYRVLKVNISTGTVSVLAGSGTAGYAEGTGTAAQFENIWGVELYGDYLYVADGDGFDDMIRKINVTTGETSSFATDSNMMAINFGAGLRVYNGYIYLCNQGIGTIHKFNVDDDSDNETFAGYERFGHRNGTNPLFGRPHDMAMTQDGTTFYLADNNKIRKIVKATGNTTYVTGSSVDNYREGLPVGAPGGIGAEARFSTIASVAVNNAGTALYLVDRWNNRVRKVDLSDPDYQTYLISGAGRINTTGTQRNGYQEGIKCDSVKNKDESFTKQSGCAYFDNPAGIVISPDNAYLYVSDTNNQRIRKVRIADGQTSLVAGSGTAGYLNGEATTAQFHTPYGLTIDANGDFLYVADRDNHVIRKIDTATGFVSTLAGKGSAGYLDAIGTSAYFSYPEYIKMGADGNLYVTEVGSQRVRVIDTVSGDTRLVAGSGYRGYKNGAKEEAEFNNPEGLVPDTANNSVYVLDSWNDVIRQVDIEGEIPHTEPAPTVTAVIPDFVEPKWDDGSGLRVRITGTNFRHGAVTHFYTYQASATYVVSDTELVAELPLSQMSAGYYDVTVTNLDGQAAYLSKGIGISDNLGNVPGEHFSVPGAETEEATEVSIAPGNSFYAYSETIRGGFYVAVGNVQGDGREEILTGTGIGLGPQVRIFDLEGGLKTTFFAYAEHLRSGVRVAVGDLNGDGYNEIITAPGPGGRPHIRTFSGDGQALNAGFFALDGQFQGGAFVACGDVNGDGQDEIIVTAGPGGGPHVTVHNGDGDLLATFFAYDQHTFRYGIRPAVLDVDGDGHMEILTGPETGSPHIQTFQIRPGEIRQLNPGFYAYDPDYKGGVAVTGGDMDGDGADEIIAGVGDAASPLVRLFYSDGSGYLRKEFYAYPTTFLSGVNVASGDVDGDDIDEVITSPRADGGPQIRIIEVDRL
ncbi:MAG: FG-GAP-like repeat-containing protein [Patescibacteria group bacterium]